MALQRGAGHLFAASKRVVAIHQNFRLLVNAFTLMPGIIRCLACAAGIVAQGNGVFI